MSVGKLVRLPLPGPERFERFIAHDLNHGDFPLGMRLRDFPVNKRIIEAGSRRVGRRAGVVYAGGSRPIDGPQAHGTGLAGRVELATAKLEAAEFRARPSYSDDF